MKAKLLSDAGEIKEGTAVNIDAGAGSNGTRSSDDVGGESANEAPVYGVTDDAGHREEVDTRDLKITR